MTHMVAWLKTVIYIKYFFFILVPKNIIIKNNHELYWILKTLCRIHKRFSRFYPNQSLMSIWCQKMQVEKLKLFGINYFTGITHYNINIKQHKNHK